MIIGIISLAELDAKCPSVYIRIPPAVQNWMGLISDNPVENQAEMPVRCADDNEGGTVDEKSIMPWTTPEIPRLELGICPVNQQGP